MRTLAWLILTFACGAAYEFGCAMWVRFAERRQPMRAVAWSCFNYSEAYGLTCCRRVTT